MAALTPPAGDATWVDALLKYIPPVMLAMFGGLVNLLNTKRPYFSFKLFIIGIVPAGFVGLILKATCLHLGLSEEMTTITAALGGYCWRDVLDVLKGILIERIKKAGGD